MSQRNDLRIWYVFGCLGALALGMLLIPLREMTDASTFAFVFLALTIVVAEVGGRGPAVATAVLSALSLNFFLTQPYLTLSIAKQEDLIAFVALTVCGLISAAFGKRRQVLNQAVQRSAKGLDVLKELTAQLREKKSLEEILRSLRRQFDLGSIAIRNAKGEVVAASFVDQVYPPAKTRLNPDSLFSSEEDFHRLGAKGFRLPPGGGRIRMATGQGEVSLDLHEGNRDGFDLDETKTLSIALGLLFHEYFPESRPEA